MSRETPVRHGPAGGLRLRAYRWFQREWVRGRVLIARDPERWTPFRERSLTSSAAAFVAGAGLPAPAAGAAVPAAAPAGRTAWFHAASAGELESLWPLVREWLARGNPAVVTIFSRSAELRLGRLREELGRDFPTASLRTGFSPWEGEWEDALSRERPAVFVTAKYEAWPDLWISLARAGIPLAIVGAQARRSLVVCARTCGWLGEALPRLVLLTATESAVAGLRRILPRAEIAVTGEPRWDQVFARAQTGSARARGLLEAARGRARPWGVLAQVWPEDLERMKEKLGQVPGTLWVVPHRVDEESVWLITKLLGESGVRAAKTSEGAAERSEIRHLLVDEMGFLSELYSGADWAYVGGGFGKGLHSTIEPAIHGLPIAAGPARSDRFPEVAELREAGELTLVADGKSLGAWLERIPAESATGLGREARARWAALAQARRGASARVLDVLENLLATRQGA